ncbi:MAG: tRNA pseudouridine(55) synthase TruB [Phycisphaerales bacterium]|nr:tRNA pseudouridine(55) synthase TruB [Phycisphaerales bacterium]
MDAGDKPMGILILDKPKGLSSMQAIARVRRRAGGVRTGHAGTLDPLATGILVVALGKATKSIDRLMDTEKRYRTVIDLSAFTTTDDAEGDRTERAVPVPPDEQSVREVLLRFVGTIEQRPPAYSAMKVGGRRAYSLARKGAPPTLAPRPVRIDALELVRYLWPLLEIDVRCGKGTYIRSLARDVGEALGTGGHCQALRRTAVGPFDESMARTLDDLPERIGSADVMPLAIAMDLLSDGTAPGSR